MVKEITEIEDFRALLAEASSAGKLLVVDFHAQWCGPCKMIAPKIVAFAEEMKDFCLFAKVDVDEAAEIAEEYEIQAMPTFLLFAGGQKEPVDKMAGANAEKLRQMIEKNKF